MQPATAISILTVGVFVVSVVANLYIARASRKTSLEVLRFKARLDRADASANLIRSSRLRANGYGFVVTN